MADLMKLNKLISRVACGAFAASKPTGVFFGTVTSIVPLVITVDAKHVLTNEFLILSRNVTNHWVDMTVDHLTEDETEHTHAVIDTYTGGGASIPTEHKHKYTGRKRYFVHNALILGERVILIREQGGQRYIVTDRVG